MYTPSRICFLQQYGPLSLAAVLDWRISPRGDWQEDEGDQKKQGHFVFFAQKGQEDQQEEAGRTVWV